MWNAIVNLDSTLINFFHRWSFLIARLSLGIVYGWFGILKLVGASPANPLVDSLLQRTLPFLTFDQFIVILGWWELTIAVAFLIPRLERLALVLLAPHLVVTTMPLLLLTPMTWQARWIPTLEGQYIIKNAAIAALALSFLGHVEPLNRR